MSRKQMGYFEINKKKYAIFEGLNVIGRDMRATVLLKDVKFSKQHAIISILDDNTQFISDFGSCNGTKLRDALLEPYKFYNLTGEDQISFSDVTGIYHKFTIPQPKIPESQSIPESQTCDHFALTQKLPNETIQNMHDCPTQTYNVNESIIDQINSAEIQGLLSHEVKTRKLAIQDAETQNSQSPKCDFKTPVLKSNNTIRTQKLPIHEANTQELPIHDTKTQGLAIHNTEIQNPNHKTSIINKNQGLPIHEALTQGLTIDDSETQNLSCTPNLPTSQDNGLKTQSTNENQLLATNNIHDTISQNISSVTQNIELYDDVFANETFRLSLINNNNTMYGVEVDETVLTPDKSKTTDSDQDSIDMLTEAATQDFAVQKSPKLVCVPQSFEGEIKSPVTSVISPNRNLKTTLTSVKGDSDSGTDIEGGVLANLSLTGKIAALESKIRKKKFASRQNQTYKSSPVQKKSFNSDSETDMEDNIGLKVNEECSKQIVAQPENRKIIESDSETDAEDYLIQKSKPVDDDSTDIEDNLELIKTIDEASKTMDASRDLVKIPVDDDLTEVEDNLELIKKIDAATKHNDNNGNAKRKSIKNDIKTKTRVSSKNKTNNKNNAPVNTSTNNQIKSNNNIDEDDDATDDDLDLLAPTQKLSYFNSQASTQQATQNRNYTSDKVDIYSAETQKLDVSDFADDMIPTSRFLTDLKLKKIDNHVVATQDFDFLAPTQLLTERPIQDSAPMLETQDVDFLAPTQLLESTSKPLANSKSQIEDDYLAPTQILLPILSGPFAKTLEPKPSTSKNTDFYFGSKSPRPALQNESIYDAPTQKFTIHTSIFNAPTQRLSAGDGKLCSAVEDEEDVFMAPTQMLSIPDGDGTDKNNTAASASDAMRLYLSDINEDDIQPTQKLDLSAFETKESKAKKLEQDKSESLKRTSKDHSELPNNENNIDTTTEKSIYTLAKESETQLEVDFALPTQKLYVEEQTSRPNNPVANMFDEENTQTQDEIFDTVPVQNISKSTIIVEKQTLRDPEPSASNSNNQNDSKTKPLTHSDPESVSNKENQSEPKSLEVKPGPIKRSLRKKPESPKASNKKLTPKLTKESKEFNESNSSKLTPKPNPTKRTIQSDLESSLDSNQESSNALKRNLDEGEPVSNKRLRKPSWKVLDKTKSPKGRKTGDIQTPKKRRSTRQTISRASEDTSLSDDDSRYGMGDSARKDKLLSATSHAVDGFYSNPTTSKAGRGDGSSAQKQIQSLSETLKSKFMTKSVQNSPRTRIKRKSKLVVRSEPVEPIAIIDDSDSDGSSIESYIKRKVFKMDDTETDYTSSSCSTIRPRKSGRHKIEDYSSDETEPSTSILADTKRYETLNVTSQPQNVKHKVAFTMLNDDKLEEKVEILGGNVTMNIYSSTVLVTNKISRSLKFLVAVSLAKPIVGDKWIKESMKKKRFLDPWDYLLEDRESETSYNFVLKDSIYRALKKKLLLNYTILLAVKKNFDVLKEIIESCGGKVVTRAPSKSLTGIFIVVGYPDEPAKYSRYLKQKATVVSAEAIFAGVLHQKMSINKHLLS